MPFDGNAARENWDRARAMPCKLDLKDPGNTPDLNIMVDTMVNKVAGAGWSGRRFTDTQFLGCAAEATTAILTGMFRKRPRFTPWGSAQYITIRDNLHPGMRELKWHERGAALNDLGNGIYAPNVSPDREVMALKKVNSQKFVYVKHKVSITQSDMWEAELNGYSEMEEKGRDLMEAHLRAINTLIRSGNADAGVAGVMTYEGIRRRTASANWTTGTADAIFDDLKAAIVEFVSSDTEEMAPSRLVLGNAQIEQFNTAERTETGKILRERVETAWAGSGMTVVPDPGMKTAGDGGGAAALLYTPDEDLISVSMPLYMWMPAPFQVNSTTIEWEMWSMYCGPQIKDTETVMVIEGAGAGW